MNLANGPALPTASDPRLHRFTLPCPPTWMEVSSVHTLWIGLHWSWMMSRQMEPSLYTAGRGVKREEGWGASKRTQ